MCRQFHIRMTSLLWVLGAAIVVTVGGLIGDAKVSPANATSYWIISPDWALEDQQGNNYAYHRLYIQWDGWYGGNTSSDYSELRTTVTSPLSKYDSWNAERTDGPYIGGYYITLSYSGNSYVDVYTNNPQYVSIAWGYGVNNRLIKMAVCPHGWCNSSALSWWGPYIV